MPAISSSVLISWTRLLSALKPQSEIFQWPPSLWPEHFTLENFQKTISRANFGIYFLNSAIV